MRTHRIVALIAVSGVACAAEAQPATEIRFANGTNAITVAPGSAVPVSVYATGLPSVGSNIPWTTFPGTGQNGYYQGFASVLMNVNATGGAWSGLTLPPPFANLWGSAGTPVGSNVHGINLGVAFNPPVTGHALLLWQGTLTVGTESVSLATAIQPVGAPPNGPHLGFEVQLDIGPSPVFYSHFLATTNGSGVITVPGPGGLALLGLVGLLGARRGRPSERRQA